MRCCISCSGCVGMSDGRGNTEILFVEDWTPDLACILHSAGLQLYPRPLQSLAWFLDCIERDCFVRTRRPPLILQRGYRPSCTVLGDLRETKRELSRDTDLKKGLEFRGCMMRRVSKRKPFSSNEAQEGWEGGRGVGVRGDCALTYCFPLLLCSLRFFVSCVVPR